MEIRALTGFDMETREQFGRSYSPLSGCNHALGAISGQPLSIPYTIPSYVPPQQIEMIDVNTGKKKFFTVSNAEKLAALVAQGMKIYGSVKGGSGSKTVRLPQPPPRSSTSIDTNRILIYGGIAAAIIALTFIIKNK